MEHNLVDENGPSKQNNLTLKALKEKINQFSGIALSSTALWWTGGISAIPHQGDERVKLFPLLHPIPSLPSELYQN